MLVQLGLLLGMFGTVTVLVDRASADLWVTSAQTRSLDESRAIPTSVAALLRMQPDIVRTEALQAREGDWHVSNTRAVVMLIGLSPAADALACPEPMRRELCARLAAPNSVVVDRAELPKLHAQVGDLVEINGQRVRVVGASDGLRSIGNTYVFMSRQTLRALAAAVFEQSLWLGRLGAVVTVVVAVLVTALASAFAAPLKLTAWAIAAALGIGLAAAVVSGLLALRELYRADPAELLR